VLCSGLDNLTAKVKLLPKNIFVLLIKIGYKTLKNKQFFNFNTILQK